MNGIRIWKPADSVRLYLPNTSTTYALCCGTTMAVFEMTMIASTATMTATIRNSFILVFPFSLRFESAADVQRQAVDGLDANFFPGGDRLVADVDGRPAAAAI